MALMKIQDEIQAELRAIGVDFGMRRAEQRVFCIPENYFLDFPGKITELIRWAESTEDPKLSLPETSVFEVPEGYFENFGQALQARLEDFRQITEQGATPWPTAKATPYQIPEGYFEGFEENIQKLLFEQEIPADQEVEQLSPLLSGLKNAQPYQVPAGYFEKPVHTGAEPRAKAIEHPSTRSIKLARWVAAASVIFILMFGGWQFLGNTSGTDLNPGTSFEKSLAEIPNARIKDWLSNNLDEADISGLQLTAADTRSLTAEASLQRFSEQEIIDFLETEVW
jgi:hypothetical protein